jgi:hypothetical protein
LVKVGVVRRSIKIVVERALNRRCQRAFELPKMGLPLRASILGDRSRANRPDAIGRNEPYRYFRKKEFSLCRPD